MGSPCAGMWKTASSWVPRVRMFNERWEERILTPLPRAVKGSRGMPPENIPSVRPVACKSNPSGSRINSHHAESQRCKESKFVRL